MTDGSPDCDDNAETSVFYQSMMGWKNLQDWAQRVWAKHYQQSPIGSTQNVRPIIVHGALGIEYVSSAAESSPCDHNAPIGEVETKFSYHGSSHPANQHEVFVSPNSSPVNQNEVSNAAARPAIQSSVMANQNEALKIAAKTANQSSVMANENVAAGRGSGYICCRGDAVNKLNVRSQVDVASPIERDLQAAARHRERRASQARLEQTMKNSKKSRCT